MHDVDRSDDDSGYFGAIFAQAWLLGVLVSSLYLMSTLGEHHGWNRVGVAAAMVSLLLVTVFFLFLMMDEQMLLLWLATVPLGIALVFARTEDANEGVVGYALRSAGWRRCFWPS